jgi:hypothetical protein
MSSMIIAFGRKLKCEDGALLITADPFLNNRRAGVLSLAATPTR